MTNQTDSPNVEINEIELPNAINSGIPSMTEQSIFIIQNGLHVQGNISADGTVTATSFIGDGSQLTGITGAGIELTDLSVAVEVAGTTNLEYDNITGVFTYTPPDISKLDGIEDGADVTDTTNVTAAGALMDSELTSIASVKALDQGVATTDSPTFAGLTVDTNTLYVDSTNNSVGIGTSAPASILEIAKNDQTNGATLSITNSFEGGGWTAGDTVGSIDFRIDDFSAPEKVRGQIKLFDDTSVSSTYPASNAMSFSTSLLGTFAERMRISSAGHVLVGKNATGTGTVGAELRANGFNAFVRDGGEVMNINRLSSDGTIIDLRQASATVGSISTVGGDLNIGTGDTGIRFRDEFDCIQPHNISTNSTPDGVLSLGKTGAAFKDLHLSGGVYLGGTVAANKLDDYEEGTWTPTITGVTSGAATFTVNQALYTKVGRAVHVSCYIINADVTGLVGTIIVGGLPFTANGFAMTKSGYSTLFSFDQQTIEVAGYTENGAAYIRLQKGSSITAISGTDATAAGDGRIMMNFTYQTS